MFEVALTIQACLRAGTRADVAWMVEADGLPVDDWSDALVFTPGGGRIGSMAGGALDGKLDDVAGRWTTGRLLDVEVTDIDALIAGLPTGGSGKCLLIPADVLPAGLVELVVKRQPVCLVGLVEADEVVELHLYTAETITEAGEAAETLFSGGGSASMMSDDAVVTVFRAVPQLIIVGASPVADALSELARVVGWRARVVTDASGAAGVIAGLSSFDKVVVTAHDLDIAGAGLMAALESPVGYIGSMGARRMQENRADWLAYRGVTDLTRVHGPAGLEIGAHSPAEIAVSILAEAIAVGAPDRVGSQP